MNYILTIIVLILINTNSQNTLKFDKSNVECEDKWFHIKWIKLVVMFLGSFIWIRKLV